MKTRTKFVGLAAAAIILAAGGAGTVSGASGPRIASPVPDTIPVALLLDLSTGQRLLARETDRRFVPASVTKVMTVYSAFKLIDEGKLSPEMHFQVSQQLEDEWSGEGSTMFLQAGEQPTIGELLLGATTVSGNDACVALALAAVGSQEKWLALMNQNAADLGMRNTHFGGANGFPDGGTTYTTADDLAKLGEAMVTRYPGLYRRYFGHRRLTWRNITQENHDPITGRVEGADGIKTGYTGEAGFTFLGSAERGGRRLMIVIAGAPTENLRDVTARGLLEWGFAHFHRHQLLPAGTRIGSVQVQQGAEDHVPLRIAKDLYTSAPEGEEARMTTQIVYRGPVQAPIAEGAQIASLRISYPGQLPYDVPLEAAVAVPEAGLLGRISNGLKGLFS